MLEHVKLKFGSSPSAPPLEFAATAVTVFVGPNYSGKSKIIAELLNRCSQGLRANDDVILDEIIFRPVPVDQVVGRIERIKVPPNPGEAINPNFVTVGGRAARMQVPEGALAHALASPNADHNTRQQFASWFLSYQVLMLDGKNRINLTNDQDGGDLEGPLRNSFQLLFHDDEKRALLSELVYQAFGLYLVVDPTKLGVLRLRLSKTKPQSPGLERSLTKEAIEFHRAATHIQDTSDGAKAFVGVLAEIAVGNPEVLLMDEPEAFLHPGLAFTLGREIAETISSTNKKMFVSTHSPQFLMGLIQSGVRINVVRLTYRNGVSTARLLPGDELIRLMRNTLLRSTGVISALFYESAVVTEADPDRAFYQEINDRLLRLGSGRGISNCIFLNAQNKQTIPTIIMPLRKLGIPAAAIYDVDLVKDGGMTATSYLTAAGVPTLYQTALTTARANLYEALVKTGKNFKREGGIKLLDKQGQEAARNYLDQLASYGTFIVSGGELESWLPQLAATGHGPAWLIQVFEKMGEDPAATNFVHPGDDDVWKFMDDIRNWLVDPNRRGIPD